VKINEFQQALGQVDLDKVQTLKDLVTAHKQIIIIGNGGSNSIASHISQDYTKQLGKRSFSFSDPSRLTCYINDYGMEVAYQQFLKEFADKDSLVILISSSGNSENIVNCAKYCIDSKIKMITLSGFSENNKLKTLTEESYLHFWVDSSDYGVVECLHQVILHTVV
jgi:D-sedoheptulose 7-phosphate isomerase